MAQAQHHKALTLLQYNPPLHSKQLQLPIIHDLFFEAIDSYLYIGQLEISRLLMEGLKDQI